MKAIEHYFPTATFDFHFILRVYFFKVCQLPVDLLGGRKENDCAIFPKAERRTGKSGSFLTIPYITMSLLVSAKSCITGFYLLSLWIKS